MQLSTRIQGCISITLAEYLNMYQQFVRLIKKETKKNKEYHNNQRFFPNLYTAMLARDQIQCSINREVCRNCRASNMHLWSASIKLDIIQVCQGNVLWVYIRYVLSPANLNMFMGTRKLLVNESICSCIEQLGQLENLQSSRRNKIQCKPKYIHILNTDTQELCVL